jgi:hypothetical protein
VKNLVLVGAALALSVTNVGGQSAPNASPADVARDFFAAQRGGRWLDAAHLLDLKLFEPQRARSVANARATRPFHLTVERLLRDDPSMPRAVAEYQVKQSEAAFRDFNPLSYEYADVPTADSLAALPIDVAAARWLEAQDPRWRMKSQPRSFSQSCTQMSDSGMKRVKTIDGAAAASLYTPPPREVVAVASAGRTAPGLGDSLSYVLYREQYGISGVRPTERMARPEMRSSPRVLTLNRTASGWRVLPLMDFMEGLMIRAVNVDCDLDSTQKKK